MDSDLVFSSIDMVTKSLSKGEVILLSSKNGESPNPMVIGWGGITYIWGKPCFIVMVRSSRFSYHLIDEFKDFSINVMKEEDREIIKTCGSISGRDTNKISSLNISLLPSKIIATPVIEKAQLKIECTKLGKLEMSEELIDSLVIEKFYNTLVKKENVLHDFYIGEIKEIYK